MRPGGPTRLAGIRLRSCPAVAALLALAACSPEVPAPEPAADGKVAEASLDSTVSRAGDLWKGGELLEDRGRVDEALDRYREAIDIGPYNEAWRYHFGERFVHRRPLTEVEAYYREAIRHDPKPQTSHYFWAKALTVAERHDEAVLHLQHAIEIDPAHEMSYETLGDIMLARGRADEAVAFYRSAVEVHPEHRSSHERLAMVLDRLGDPERAEQHRERARLSDPATPRRFLYWGRALLRAGRTLPAIAELERAVSALPDDPDARALLERSRTLAADSPLPPVILISVDTLRADHLNCYGYRRRRTSPGIDALAADGILLENHISASPWTTPSHMSLFTGLYPTAHGMTRSFRELMAGVTAGRSVSRLAESHLTLAEALRARGYRTAAFTGGGTMAPELGFDQGFETYDTSMHKLSDANVERMLSWVRRQGEQPFFLFWHNFEVHAPYLETDFLAEVLDPPRASAVAAGHEELAAAPAGNAGLVERQRLVGAGSRLLQQHGAMDPEVTRALYDGCILSFDRYLGRLVGVLEETGLYERSMIVLTSDHGEEFAEHSALFYDAHGHSVYEELVRVPLIIKLPGQDRAGTRVRQVNRNIDVMPTILEALGDSASRPPSQGDSLQPFWESSDGGSRIAVSEALAEDMEMKSVRTERYKYIMAIMPEVVATRGRAFVPEHPAGRGLFDVLRDPGERENLLATAPGAEIEREEKALLEILRRHAETRHRSTGRADLSDETLERLRALGYID